jgi:expansin (peptidoglycan-binding protein)
MATLTPQDLALTGVAPTYNTAAAGGDVFVNDGKTYVHLKNGSGASIDVTFDAVASIDTAQAGTIPVADTVVAVPAGGERIVGFLPPARFNNASGQVAMTYSGVTSLTVAVIRAPRAY